MNYNIIFVADGICRAHRRRAQRDLSSMVAIFADVMTARK